jgi:RHS repeat-associated protein
LVYDAWNRLVKYKNGGTTLETMAYDGLGRRVVENPGTARDLYYSKDWQVLEERVGGVAKVQYVWGALYVDDLVLRDRDSTGGGTLNERLWAQQDANWNVTALVNGSGSVVERYVYDPYGSVTVLNASWTTLGSSAYAMNYGPQGERLDGTTGLVYSRGRDRSPTMDRWAEADPSGFGGGDVNLYRAEGDAPVARLDPGGLSWDPLDMNWEGDTYKGGFTTQGITAIPSTPGNHGDAAMELDAQLQARSRLAAEGRTLPPLMAGNVTVYGMDGNQNAFQAMAQAGQMTTAMSRSAMTPFYFTPIAPLAHLADLPFAFSEGDYRGAAFDVAGVGLAGNWGWGRGGNPGRGPYSMPGNSSTPGAWNDVLGGSLRQNMAAGAGGGRLRSFGGWLVKFSMKPSDSKYLHYISWGGAITIPLASLLNTEWSSPRKVDTELRRA